MSVFRWLNNPEPESMLKGPEDSLPPVPDAGAGSASVTAQNALALTPEPMQSNAASGQEAQDLALPMPNSQGYQAPSHGLATPVSEDELQALEERIIAALKTVFDPEIPVNIYDLGLIYGLNLEPQIAHVEIEMTLTAPGCPVAQTFPGEVEQRVMEVPGVNSAHVELVWEPPWTRERMSEAAMLTLGML